MDSCGNECDLDKSIHGSTRIQMGDNHFVYTGRNIGLSLKVTFFFFTNKSNKRKK